MRVVFKLLAVFPLFILYGMIAGAVIFLPLGGRMRRMLRIRTVAFFCRLILALIGVRVRVSHHERLHAPARGLLVAANHVSYLDVFILASLMPSVFITSVELRSTVFLGTLARLGGCLFVERRKASGLKQEMSAIAAVLKQGFVVVLFPEGTTSDGGHVHPFKNSLFDTAIEAGVDILPVCIRYVRVNGTPMGPAVRDSVYYYGGTTIFQHVPRLLFLRSVEAEVLPLKRIAAGADASRKDLAARAHAEISQAYGA